MELYKICATGHRPNKLPGGYDINSIENQELIDNIKAIITERLEEHDSVQMISGMALGVDTLYALAAIELKEEMYPVELHLAIPCMNQEKMWPQDSQDLYHIVIQNADSVHYVTETDYTNSCMHDRNQYMINESNEILAVLRNDVDNSRSGTLSTVNKGIKIGKQITRLNPVNYDIT